MKQSCRREIVFTTDPTRWPPRVEGVLFCWEAFVSQGAHADTHLKDAATAVVEFFPSGESVRMVITVDPMHDEEWTKMATMGWTSQLTKLDKRFGGQKG